MKHTVIVCLCAALLLSVLGAATAFAMAADNVTPFAHKDARTGMTDEQKASMEKALSDFLAMLTPEQKAAYDACHPERKAAADGAPLQKPTTEEMEALKAKRDAFIASLTPELKTAYDALRPEKGFTKGERPALTDEQKALLEQKKAELDAKLKAFTESLNAQQKAAFEALTPHKPSTEGTPPSRPTEADMSALKEKRDAFINSLSDEQQKTFEALYGGRGGKRGQSDASATATASL